MAKTQLRAHREHELDQIRRLIDMMSAALPELVAKFHQLNGTSPHYYTKRKRK